MMRKGSLWTEEETALAQELNGQGCSHSEISRKLAERGFGHRSKKSILMRLIRIQSGPTLNRTMWSEVELELIERGVGKGLQISAIHDELLSAGFQRTKMALATKLAQRPRQVRSVTSSNWAQDVKYKQAVLKAHPRIDIGVVKDARPIGPCTSVRAVRSPLFSPEGSHF
ncbi:hypothetical protein [Castellaniella sp.]|uniref:hypothetical protein n=1 Tax=Castellaniella sp. TaxID=1955812 RepID=UPI002AFE4E4E|nr:hypothetical protein [Castellaniella sp.]